MGFPEMSEMSKSAGKRRFSCRSSDGRFIVEKNIRFGMVSMKICGTADISDQNLNRFINSSK